MAKIETKIGKDVIESLTLGMYEDARFIYREYVQNSADQIDLAIENGLLNAEKGGGIEIEINATDKRIAIFDNATGIQAGLVPSILKNIAKSTKDRTKNKGFRGIGRLGGLGYCDKLIFETSFAGEATKSRLIWDAQKLKAIINNRATKEDAAWVIDEVTELHIEDEKEDTHYFKVVLEGVTNDTLLDKEHIYEYLSMVAPVSFSKGFIFKDQIYQKAASLDYTIDEYAVFVNGDQVFKGYTSSIYDGEANNKRKIDEIHDIETFELRSSKDKLLVWGWYGVSSFTKMIPKVNIARNLRLRKGNIQIGLEDVLVKLFKEDRGTKYFFGELHVVDPNLIPNARRDYFLENSELKEFEQLAKLKFEQLHKLYHFSSKVRSEQRKIDDFVAFSKEFEEKSVKTGFTDDKEKKEYQKKLEAKQAKAKSAERKLERTMERVQEVPTAQKKVFEKVVGDMVGEQQESIVEQVVEHVTTVQESNKTKYITDDIDKLNNKGKKIVTRVFSVIDRVLPKDLANILKEKIKEELQ